VTITVKEYDVHVLLTSSSIAQARACERLTGSIGQRANTRVGRSGVFFSVAALLKKAPEGAALHLAISILALQVLHSHPYPRLNEVVGLVH